MNVKLGIQIFTLLFAATFAGCQNAQTAATNNTNAKVATVTASANTPTEAYRNLYAAVKSKDTETIKQFMSKATQELGEMQAQMQKKPVDEVYKNGFYESTMSPNLPPMRDERVKDNFGAVEVQKTGGTWEDVYFVKEDGGWKIAVGDVFKGSYQLPAKPASQANANTQMPQMIPMPSTNSNSKGSLKTVPVNPNPANVNANSAVVKPGTPDKPSNK